VGYISGVRVELLLTAVVGLGALSIDMFLPSLPAIATAFAAPPATVQLTVTLFLVAFAVAQLVYGPLSDRYGRRGVLIGGLALYTVAGLACAVAPGVGVLVAARVLQALGGGSGPVVARAVVRDLYDRDRAARVFSYMSMAQSLNPMLAPVLGGYVHEAFGWRAVFWVLAGAGALLTALMALGVRETNVRRDPTALNPGQMGRNVGELLSDRSYLGYVMVNALMFGGQFAFISGSSFVLIGVLGVSPSAFGLCFGTVALGILTGTFLSGRFGGRLGLDQTIQVGTTLGAGAGLVLAGLAWSGVLTVAAVVAPMYVFAVGLGLTLPNGMAGAIGPFPRMAGLAAAVAGFLQMTGSALYSMAVGHFFDGTARPMATAIALAGCVAAIGFRSLRSRPGRDVLA
jgi:DHA1 family bicyclomycin/chloramphenicol resistance-like MFS transporter